MKIDWKKKLASRKFWAAAATLVGAVLVACNVDEGSVAQVASIISAAGVMAVYILGESAIDAAHAGYHDDSDGGDKSDILS